MDADQDGLTDIVSGSWPGELYFFRGQSDRSFEKRETFKTKDSTPINLGSASTVFVTDWDSDRDLDLLVGNIAGKVYLVPNTSQGKDLRFGEAVELVSLIEHKVGDSHPIAADWDRDGDLDLLVGHSEGGVLWCRNVGTRTKPHLSDPRELIPKSPAPWTSDVERTPKQWGVRAKICVTDWNHDGWPDVLLGDRCGSFSDAPNKTPEELVLERTALEQLPAVKKEWAESFREYRRLTLRNDSNAEGREAELLERMRELKETIARCQRIQAEFEPQRQAHGYVWLFQRKPEDESSP